MHAVLKEVFATLVIAAAVIAIVAALGIAVVVLAVILPLAFMGLQARRARETRREPLVLVQAREIASRAASRSHRTELAIVRSTPTDAELVRPGAA